MNNEIKINKYHLSEYIEPDHTLWIIERTAPNSGDVVFETLNKNEAFNRLDELNSIIDLC